MPNQKLWKFLIWPTSAHAQMSEERRDHTPAIATHASSRPLERFSSFTNVRFHRIAMALTIAAALGLWGCGGSSTSSPAPASPSLVSVTVTPNSVTVLRDATQAFTAKVTGTTNTAVTWSVEESSGGTIDSAGLYTPPQNGAGAFHVIATSQANAAAAGAAVVAIPMPKITIDPVAVTLRPDGMRTFAATVSGLTNTAVNFTIQQSAGGLINSAGLYTAPAAGGFYNVVATSIDETTVTASATVTVTNSSSGFTPTGSLVEARGLHTATLLPDNKVLVAYGSNSSAYTNATGYVGLSSIEVYNAGTGTFTEIVGESGAGIYGHTGTLLQNGNVLLAGGFFNSVWDYGGSISDNGAGLYDSATGVFSGTGNMTANRGDHTATLLADGKVLIAGGADQDSTGTGLASAELYDPSTGTFTRTGSMAVGRFLHTATLLQSGKVLIVGGALTSASDPVATAEVYDPATGIFTMTHAMATAREQHTATLLADGRVLIVGGATSAGAADPTATAEVYDPSTGSFSVTGSMAEARTYHTATLLPSGKVLVVGGGDENSTAEVYDPATGSFSVTGGMEIGRSGHTATLLPSGSVLVAGGGIFAGLASAELYQ
jgi:Bacterial Ig-like domain (group 2)/Galactose oxidase, central domain